MATNWNGDDVKLYKKLEGARVSRVEPGDAATVTVWLEDGRGLRLALDGDCCSSSYYSDMAQFNELVGSTIRGVEERDGESRDGLDEDAKKLEKEKGEYRDEVSWHFLVFTTDKGHVTIDWRNDSNGYYDGSVRPSIV